MTLWVGDICNDVQEIISEQRKMKRRIVCFANIYEIHAPDDIVIMACNAICLNIFIEWERKKRSMFWLVASLFICMYAKMWFIFSCIPLFAVWIDKSWDFFLEEISIFYSFFVTMSLLLLKELEHFVFMRSNECFARETDCVTFYIKLSGRKIGCWAFSRKKR